MDAIVKFWTNLHRWLRWLEESLQTSSKRAEEAARFPGLHHDSNYYRTEDGQIWKETGAGWYTGNRPAGSFEKYQWAPQGRGKWAPYPDLVELEDGRQIKMVCASWSDFASAWAWERVPGEDTESCYRRDIASLRHGLAFGKALLSQKGEIEAWMKDRAEKDGAARAVECMSGFEDMLARFASSYRYSELPDTGSLRAYLHGALDALAGAGGRWTRCW